MRVTPTITPVQKVTITLDREEAITVGRALRFALKRGTPRSPRTHCIVTDLHRELGHALFPLHTIRPDWANSRSYGDV
jgi:hypothetical protein